MPVLIACAALVLGLACGVACKSLALRSVRARRLRRQVALSRVDQALGRAERNSSDKEGDSGAP